MDQTKAIIKNTRRGNLAFLMIIIVVIMFVMSAIVTMLLGITHNQTKAVAQFQALADETAVVEILSSQGQLYLSRGIEAGSFSITDFSDEIVQETFINTMKAYVPADLQDDFVILGVSMDNNVEVYKHDEPNHYYDLVSININFFKNGSSEVLSIGFFRSKSAGHANVGVDYEEGDFVCSWNQ